MAGFWLQTKFYQIYLQKSQVFFNKNHNFRPKRTTVILREIQFLHWTSKWPKKTLFWKVNITSHGSVSFKSKLRCDSGRIWLDFDCKQNFIKFIFRNHRFFLIKIIILDQKEPPYGRAYRLGVPELQTKFYQNCLYKHTNFVI